MWLKSFLGKINLVRGKRILLDDEVEFLVPLEEKLVKVVLVKVLEVDSFSLFAVRLKTISKMVPDWSEERPQYFPGRRRIRPVQQTLSPWFFG